MLTDPTVRLLLILHSGGKSRGRGEARGGRHEPLTLEEDGLTGLPLRLHGSSGRAIVSSGWGCARRPGRLLLSNGV